MDKEKTSWQTSGKGSKSIDPNDISLRTKYAFSLNINPNRLKGTYGFDYNDYKTVLKTLFKHQDTQWRGALEYSKMGRLHYHGWVKFTSNLAKAFFYQALHGIRSYNYELDTIANIDDWITYIFKSKDHMGELANHYKLPYILGESEPCPLFKTVDRIEKNKINSQQLRDIKKFEGQIILEYD